MNILLTGGAGYIGSNVALALIRDGYEVVILDNLSNSSIQVIYDLQDFSKKNIKFFKANIADTDFVRNLLKKFKIKAVLHLAGLKSVEDSVTNPLNYYINNVSGSLSLLGAMKSEGVKNIIFSSSATVYGEPTYLPCDESHPVNPANAYGRTKIIIEKALGDLYLSDPAWNAISLRYFNPVGADQSKHFGENPNQPPNNLMPLIVKVGSGQVKKLSVFGDDYLTRDGTGERDFIHVSDIADGHVSALKLVLRGSGFNEVINLGTGKSTTVLEMIKTFERVNKITIPYNILERRNGDLGICYANPEKAGRILNWIAKRSISEMCESSWADHLRRNGLI